MVSAKRRDSGRDSLRDPRLVEAIQTLRQADNYTNIYYLARIWVVLMVVIASTISLYHAASVGAFPFWWNIPVTLVAIVIIGACQHQLAGATHEATHHMLFKNPLLNELASDWLCMFPLFSTTHQFRLNHLAHHQFINDPVRDADRAQLQLSGHWLDFPVAKATILRAFLKQFWFPNLLRYIWIRAKYNSLGIGANPYMRAGGKSSKGLAILAVVYIVGLFDLLSFLAWLRNVALLGVLPPCCWVAMVIATRRLTATQQSEGCLRPVISTRLSAVMRMTFITLLFWVFAWTSLVAGPWVLVYFLLFWVVPIFTSFAFFMVLRNIVQHGNADRGRLTNTRVFRVNPIINFAVFPFGNQYHLPHHMFATVPHYRLPQLHALLMQYSEYRDQAVQVEGYLLPSSRSPRRPTVLEVLGPNYSAPDNEVYIDDSVLGDEQVTSSIPVGQESGRDSVSRQASLVR
jgi:fatty acid desaturase